MNARKQEKDIGRLHRLGRSSEMSSKSSLQRTVPGFSVQSLQKNAVTSGPPRAKAARASDERSTAFAIAYGRLGFPLAAVYVHGQRLRWLVPPELVDYDTYLPVMADGLRERPRPYGACATLGLWELLAVDSTGDRVLSALPRTVFPIRRALDVGQRDWPTTVRALKSLQKLALAGRPGLVGPALVLYYRQLLPPINRYRRAGVTATDGLDAKVAYDLFDLCQDTLCVLERTGGPCAYSNIQSFVPTYQSCITAMARTGSTSASWSCPNPAGYGGRPVFNVGMPQ